MKIIVNYDKDKKPLKLQIPTSLFFKVLPYICTNNSLQKYGINLSEKNSEFLTLYFAKFKKQYKRQWKKQYKNWKLMEIICASGEKIEILL